MFISFNLVQDWTHGTPKLKLARYFSFSIRFQFSKVNFEVLYDSLDMDRFSAWSVHGCMGMHGAMFYLSGSRVSSFMVFL